MTGASTLYNSLFDVIKTDIVPHTELLYISEEIAIYKEAPTGILSKLAKTKLFKSLISETVIENIFFGVVASWVKGC